MKTNILPDSLGPNQAFPAEYPEPKQGQTNLLQIFHYLVRIHCFPQTLLSFTEYMYTELTQPSHKKIKYMPL